MKILVVEDHEAVRAGVRQLLAELPDADVIEAKDADEAVSAFRSHKPDIIILDIRLGGRHQGLDVLSCLIAFDSEARVIVFSLFADIAIVADALQTGARGYVSKAASADELLTAVKQVLGGERYVEESIAAAMACSTDLVAAVGDLAGRSATGGAG